MDAKMEKSKTVGLLPRIAAAIILGIGAGCCFGACGEGCAAVPEWAARVFATFGSVFSGYLSFMIPLIIAALVTASIAEMERGAGRLLAMTVAISYIDTAVCGFATLGVGKFLFPLFMDGSAGAAAAAAPYPAPAPFFTIAMPPLFDVMSALALSFIAGIGISSLRCDTLRRATCEFRDIVTAAIGKTIIPLLPLYIFCIFLKMSWTGEVAVMLVSFAKVIAVIFAMHIAVILLQFCAAGAVVRRNPFKALAAMMPAYFTALGTSSSAATIPVSHKCALDYGISKETAGFVIPLTATIHMSGSAMKITGCAIALVMMKGGTVDIAAFSGFVMMLGLVTVASPGVPGGAIMASLGILQSILGFGAEEQALMIALYMAMDSFGTACNVVGDGAIAMVVDRYARGEAETVSPAERSPAAGPGGC